MRRDHIEGNGKCESVPNGIQELGGGGQINVSEIEVELETREEKQIQVAMMKLH